MFWQTLWSGLPLVNSTTERGREETKKMDTCVWIDPGGNNLDLQWRELKVKRLHTPGWRCLPRRAGCREGQGAEKDRHVSHNQPNDCVWDRGGVCTERGREETKKVDTCVWIGPGGNNLDLQWREVKVKRLHTPEWRCLPSLSEHPNWGNLRYRPSPKRIPGFPR